jgi:DNA-binding MarR family transcriptional regulator
MSSVTLPQFADRLNEIMPVIGREFIKKQSAELVRGKITMSQVLILDFLFRQGEFKMTDLARIMEVTTAAMTGLIERLVKCGYVMRQYQPQDRRIIQVKLTARGFELIKRVTEQKRRMVMNIFGQISQAEREEYLKILTHIQEVLKREKEAR